MQPPSTGQATLRPAASLRLAVAALVAALSIPGAEAREPHRHNNDMKARAERSEGAQLFARAPRVDVQQNGLDNRAAASQTGASNIATIAQTGSLQSGAIAQTGDGNAGTIRQFGKANAGTISQTGSDNTACLVQIGKHLSTDIVQEGDGQKRGVIQTRKGSYEVSPDLCGVETASRGFWRRAANQAR